MKLAGVASILLTWAAIASIMIGAQRDLTKSISHHAPKANFRYFVFASLMTVSLALMTTFITSWISSVMNMPSNFVLFANLIILLELIATWIPLTYGWRSKVHEITSYGAAMLVPVLLALLLTSNAIRLVPFYITLAVIGFMVLTFFLFFFVRATHKHHLIYQSAYIAAFHISLLSLILFQ